MADGVTALSHRELTHLGRPDFKYMVKNVKGFFFTFGLVFSYRLQCDREHTHLFKENQRPCEHSETCCMVHFEMVGFTVYELYVD